MIEIETSASREDVHALATHVYDIGDFTAALASGGYRNLGMIVIP